MTTWSNRNTARTAGSPHPGVRSSLSLSLLLMAGGMRGGSNGTNVHHGVDAGTPRTMTPPPYLARQISKWSMTLPPVMLQEQPAWFIVGGTKALVRTSRMNTRVYMVRATGV
jgi:hypothetical protein